MRIVLIVAAALVAGILGLSLSFLVFGPNDRTAGAGSGGVLTSIGAAEIGGPFTLVDHRGRPTTEEILNGRPTLVYFGYTFCPDFCPTELANMAAAADILAERGVDVGLVFITVDPERDTPEALKDYVAAFHEDLVGLTGAPEQIAEAARAYKVIYRKSESPEYTDYLVDHTTFVYAMDANGRYLTFFRAAEDPNKIADVLAEAAS